LAVKVGTSIDLASLPCLMACRHGQDGIFFLHFC
jgi:hypothetical protein